MWSGSALVAGQTALDAIAALYPGVPTDSVPFMLQIWEDDTDPGKIHAPDYLDDVVNATIMVVDGVILVKTDVLVTRIGILAAAGGGLIIQGFSNFVGAFFDAITGGGDDFVGVIADAGTLLAATGVASSTSFAVMKGTTKNGEVSLRYVP